jgi:signal transduction histidine kinase
MLRSLPAAPTRSVRRNLRADIPEHREASPGRRQAPRRGDRRRPGHDGSTGVFFEPRIIKKTLILVVLFAIGLFTAAALLAARKRFKQVRFYVFAWLGATGSALLMALRHWFGIDDVAGVPARQHARRHDFRRRHDGARHRRSLQPAARGAPEGVAIPQLEQARAQSRHEQAPSQSRSALRPGGRDRRQAPAAYRKHGARHPPAAARAAAGGAGQHDDVSSGSDKQYREINDGFTYIEGLLGDYLNAEETEPRDAQDAVSELELGEILGSIHEMFKADAEAKGLDFTYVPTSATVPVEPLVMMRIFSNLVSNAIKYTSSGRILLGIRRRGDAMRIEIHDSGPGLSKEAFESACRRGERLEPELTQVAGHGYGLAIVTDLARRHGCRLELLGERSSGTSVGVTVPA